MRVKSISIILSGMLMVGIVFSVAQIIKASPAPPNPGHSWSELGDFPSGCTPGKYISALGTTPTCTAEVGDISGVTAGIGLSGGGTSGNVTLSPDYTFLQRRVIGYCPSGWAIRVIGSDGLVTCEPTLIGGGISACEIKHNTTSIPANTLKYNISSPACSSGYGVTGGGAQVAVVPGMYIMQSVPYSDSYWRCGFYNSYDSAYNAYCYVRCCK